MTLSHNTAIFSPMSMRLLKTLLTSKDGEADSPSCTKGSTGKLISTAELIVSCWLNRESDFEFLESDAAPDNVSDAIKLLKLMRMLEAQRDEIFTLNQTRLMEGKLPIPDEICAKTQSLEDLTFIEELIDEGLLKQLSEELEEEEGVLVETFMCALDTHLKNFVERYILETQPIEARPDQEATWLAYPCKSCKIDTWSKDLERDHFSCVESGQKALFELLNHFHQDWVKIWQTSDWSSDFRWQDDVGTMAANTVWSEFIEPYLKERASLSILHQRNKDLIDDLNGCFVNLIDAKRPKDQRIGSLWFNGDDPSMITVIFLTRDGKLLAQRDIVWDPNDPTSIVKAFEIINIRLLTYPSGLDQQFPEAFSRLQEMYNLHPVSSIVLDPVPHPQSLTQDAQKALRIGQRFVAPLRFWARTNLLELMRCISTPSVFDCLERSQSLDSLLHTLKDTAAERWLYLRKRRSHKKRGSNPYLKQDSDNLQRSRDYLSYTAKDTVETSTSNFTRGQQIKMRVLKKEGNTIYLETLNSLQKGWLRLYPRSQRPLRLQQIIKTFVLGIDPKTQELILTLDRVQNHDHLVDGTQGEQSQSPLSSQNDLSTAKHTLDRLNSLFSKDTDGETRQENARVHSKKRRSS